MVLRPGLDALDLGCGVGDLRLRLWDALQPGGYMSSLVLTTVHQATEDFKGRR